ncbi:hypothetical protein PV325_004959 [Microctonus aethiopoides]|nr:hypothetical protein PV325_004959 [Microctonus aethiopoides]KAK0077206.1 hypothetical protein PV326_010205 [Microctonus aethiopoides]
MATTSTNKYQIEWRKYSAHIHSSITTLLDSGSFSDVVLKTSCGRHLAAHRFVLAACSPYFSDQFQTCHSDENIKLPITVVGLS